MNPVHLLDPEDLRRLSATQIDSFIDCNRKWAFKQIEKIEAPAHKSAQLGTRVHAIQEAWQKEGLPPDPSEVLMLTKRQDGIDAPFAYYPGRIAMSGIHLLPPPRFGLVEQKIAIDTPRAKWRGAIDLIYGSTEEGNVIPLDSRGRNADLITILDHKTTRDFAWAKTPDILQHDPQAILYSAWAMANFGVDLVRLQWVYYRTEKKPEARLVELILEKKHVENQIRGLDDIAQEVYKVRSSGKKALEVTPNPSACDRYGGCAYKSICQHTLSEEERFLSAMSQPKSIQELLREKAGGGAQAPSAFGAAAQFQPTPAQAAPMQPQTYYQPPAAQMPPQPQHAPAAGFVPPQQPAPNPRDLIAPMMAAGAPDAAIFAVHPWAGPIVAEMRAEAAAHAAHVNSLGAQTVGQAQAAQQAQALAPAPLQSAPVIANRPTHWIPGDPLNQVQEWLHSQGKGLDVIAAAATNPPPIGSPFFEQLRAGVYPQSAQPPAAGYVNAPEAPPALSGPVPGTHHGVNVPQAQAQAAAGGAVDDLSALTRDQLKAICVQHGLCTDKDKSGIKAFADKIRSARAQGKQIGPFAPAAAPAFGGELGQLADVIVSRRNENATAEIKTLTRETCILAAFSGLVATNDPEAAIALAIHYGDEMFKTLTQ